MTSCVWMSNYDEQLFEKTSKECSSKQRAIVIIVQSCRCSSAKANRVSVNCAALFFNSNWDSMGNFSENIPQATFLHTQIFPPKAHCFFAFIFRHVPRCVCVRICASCCSHIAQNKCQDDPLT